MYEKSLSRPNRPRPFRIAPISARERGRPTPRSSPKSFRTFPAHFKPRSSVLLRPRPPGRHAQEPYAQTDRYFHDPHYRRRPDHHRPGVRVRLFGDAGLQGVARRGLSNRPHQFQSGHHHDRSRHGGPDLYRADHARDRRQDHREGARRGPGRLRAAADHGRPDGAQLRALLTQDGRPRKVRRRDDRRQRRGDRQGRGPRAVPRGDDQDRAQDAALASGEDAEPGASRARRHRLARDHPPELHPWRHRRRHRLHETRVHRDRRARHGRLADGRGAGRGERARLEGIRDGGGARQKGQLHHHLLDREHRPDGRAYRRLRSPSRPR